jgi:hypothetical protein
MVRFTDANCSMGLLLSFSSLWSTNGGVEIRVGVILVLAFLVVGADRIALEPGSQGGIIGVSVGASTKTRVVVSFGSAAAAGGV